MASHLPYNFERGEIILIDKPKGWTSFDVVKKIKYAVKQKKVGHAGTLDPLATGLLLIAIGPSTKKLNDYQLLNKSYKGIIEIGKTTPSYDLETEFDSETSYDHITEADIYECSRKFTGKMSQVPPVFSAIKNKGKRAYSLARKGEKIVLEPRNIEIEEFNIEKIDLPEIHFNTSCSKGTYIRSLAHDFGRELNTGAYLKQLERTAIGNFHLSDAWKLNDFVDQFQKQ